MHFFLFCIYTLHFSCFAYIYIYKICICFSLVICVSPSWACLQQFFKALSSKDSFNINCSFESAMYFVYMYSLRFFLKSGYLIVTMWYLWKSQSAPFPAFAAFINCWLCSSLFETFSKYLYKTLPYYVCVPWSL